MNFIPFDDYQSMVLFGMPITLAESGDDWAAMGNILPDAEPLVESFRYGTFNDEVYDLTKFTDEHVNLSIQIGEHLTWHLASHHPPRLPYRLHYNECYVIITRQRIFDAKVTGKYVNHCPNCQRIIEDHRRKGIKFLLIESPAILFEILPPEATKKIRANRFDRHRYRQCPTLEVSLLISQDEPYVEMYRKSTDWKQECISANGSIILDPLYVKLPLASIYAGVL